MRKKPTVKKHQNKDCRIGARGKMLLRTALVTVSLLFLSGLAVWLILQASHWFDTEQDKNSFVTIASSILASFLALVGVAWSITVERLSRLKDQIQSNIPELLLPGRYDISEATFVDFKLDTDKEELKRRPNKAFYIKNSAKCAFYISSFEANGVTYKPISHFNIDVKELFCIRFYSEGSLDKATLEAESLDGNIYQYKFLFVDQYPIKVWRPDKNERRTSR